MATNKEFPPEMRSDFSAQLGITQQVISSQFEGIENKNKEAAEAIRNALGELAQPMTNDLPNRLTLHSSRGNPWFPYEYDLIQYDPRNNQLLKVGKRFADWVEDDNGIGGVSLAKLDQPEILHESPLDYKGWLKYGGDVMKKLQSSSETIAKGEKVKDIDVHLPENLEDY